MLPLRNTRGTPIGLVITCCFAACVACGCAASPGPAPKASTLKVVSLGYTGKTRGMPAPAVPGKNVPAIKVDTVGYEASWTKVVIFNVEPKNAVVKDARSGQTVLRIEAAHVKARGVDAASKDPVWQVDITGLRTPGTYTIVADGAESDPFQVAQGLYDHAITAGIKSFYFQRTRTALLPPFATWEGNSYIRKTASHVHADVGWDLLDYPAKKRKWKVEGGWFDAGNFDMYVPSTAPAAESLLAAYEWAPEHFKDKQLNIPESGNGIPDLLDEARWGLVWVLSLQEDGGAFRAREAMIEWSPEGPADEDKTVRWIAGVSSAGTAKAVAALAQAARLYEKFDPVFAARCAKAAKSGWKFLLAHPNHIRATVVGGGAQPLWDDEPENNDVGARFMAAVEMWRTYRDKDALAHIESAMSLPELTDLGKIIRGAWENLSRWGLGELAMDKGSPGPLRAEAKKRILAMAEQMRPQVEQTDGYRCATQADDYYWGSNSNLMEKAHILAMAARLAPEKSWMLEAARDQWHWILGRNPNGYSMVTRVGKGPTRLYHMEWGPYEPPPPGFLIDGPNALALGFLAPGAPAKALLWDNQEPTRSGLPAHSLWHWRQSDLWDGEFLSEDEWGKGWWCVTEPDILYSGNFVLAGTSVL
ncbi:MAG TPA: glycoside hydrolase family 9 protein [Polyangia bacterium]